MTQISTRNLLVLHAYGETTPEQAERVHIALAEDDSLQAEFLELMQTQEQLFTLRRGPSSTSVRIIMDHSHKTEHLQEI